MSDVVTKLLHLLGAVGVLAVIVVLLLGMGAFSERLPRRWQKWATPLVLAGGAIVFALAGLVYPAVQTAWQSFFNSDGSGFVGLENYKWVFTDSGALIGLRNTFLWVVLVPIFSVVIGFGYALLVDKSRYENILKAMLFMPMAISFVGASVIWKFMYTYRQGGQEQIGLLNQVLVWLGLTPQQFLVNTPWNSLFLMVVVVWTQAGFAMIVMSGAIKSIPAEVIEAARLDGAGGWTILTRVTIPLVRPSLVVSLTTISVAMLKLFDVVRTMTGGQFQTTVLANMMYDQSFKYSEPGKGAAVAVLLLVLVLPVMIGNAVQMRKNKEIR
ncbi:MAG: sugar ABC transporter permease [Actinomyces sp.]|jgi:alpha-glucoside transport system permease protein|uniref:Carbohydrate ABC transporter permease n=1 Tax=Schaalia naturae TaxID=635203 RepID=A0ABW2SNX6_9ACTO|nr:sugar ABC transporter permease [Actinomyces sp.]MCI1787385.1 sugar ABC transporter permease [Actinomyces sp.]MCI1830797.1 sugar ABC transporter permease [Actinomyces sp.]